MEDLLPFNYKSTILNTATIITKGNSCRCFQVYTHALSLPVEQTESWGMLDKNVTLHQVNFYDVQFTNINFKANQKIHAQKFTYVSFKFHVAWSTLYVAMLM
jgi:hypothetical protein